MMINMATDNPLERAEDGLEVWRHIVMLDGEERYDALAADDIAGWVDVYECDPPYVPNYAFEPVTVVVIDGEVQKKRLTGDVTIVPMNKPAPGRAPGR